MYDNKSTALQIVHRGEIESIKLENYANAEDFANDFEKGFNKLKAARATITEGEKLKLYVKSTADVTESYRWYQRCVARKG